MMTIPILLVCISVVLNTQVGLPIDFLAVVCIYFALKLRRRTVGILCLLGGLLENLCSNSPLGLRSLSLASACWTMGILTQMIYSEHQMTQFVSVLVGSALALFFEWLGLRLIYESFPLFSTLKEVLLPMAFWSACFSVLVMPLFDRLGGKRYERWMVS